MFIPLSTPGSAAVHVTPGGSIVCYSGRDQIALLSYSVASLGSGRIALRETNQTTERPQVLEARSLPSAYIGISVVLLRLDVMFHLHSMKNVFVY